MKTLLTILITALATSLFWLLGIYGVALISYTPKEVVIEDIKMNYDSVEEPTQSVVTDAPAPEDEKFKKSAKNYAELICGFWLPVEGTTSKLDISKYGTVTRHYKLYSSWHEDRYEYSISGNKLNINRWYKCTVNVFEKKGITYLEIYGHENYAGKYRKGVKDNE